jgi:hypothetical protein
MKSKIVNAILVVYFLCFSFHNEKTKYYTSFLVEDIPIFWWLMVVFFNKKTETLLLGFEIKCQ